MHSLSFVPDDAVSKRLIGGKRIILINLFPYLYTRRSSAHWPDFEVSEPVRFWFPFHDVYESLHHLTVFGFDALIVNLFLDFVPLRKVLKLPKRPRCGVIYLTL